MATLAIGGIGDSIMNGSGLGAGEDPLSQMDAHLTACGKYSSVVTVNEAIDGSETGDWLSGSSNLNDAKTAFASASVTHVMIMLGANDAATANHVAAATYGSNLSNICADLTGAGYKVVLHWPTFIPAGANGGATDAASVALTLQYLTVIDNLVNGTTILQGDQSSYEYFTNHAFGEPDPMVDSDETHPTVTGASRLGMLWARSIESYRWFFNEGAEELLSNGTVDWATDTIKARLVDLAVQPSIDSTAMTGYTAIGTDQTLASKTKTKDDTLDRIVFDAADPSFTGIDPDLDAAFLVVYKDGADDANRKPLVCTPILDVYTDGDDLRVILSNSGLAFTQQ